MTVNILNIVYGLVCVVVVCINAAPQSKLPKGFIQCKKSDPKLDECFKMALRSAFPHLIKGVPNLGINQMDPLRISTLSIDQGTGTFNLKLDFKNLDMYNLGSIIVDKIHYNKETYTMIAEVHPEKPVILEGDYETSGKILILPIVGKGRCKIVLNISHFFCKIEMKPVEKKGNTYLDIEKFTWNITPTNMKCRLDNLFNGDKALGDNMNVFINENWRELFKELQPAIEEVFGKAFKDIGQNFLTRIPVNQILID